MNTSVNDLPQTKNIIFVLFDGVTLVDFVGATEVFNNVPGFNIHWAAPSMNAITTSEKMQVLPTCTFDNGPEDAEILFIPGGFSKGVSDAMFDNRYREYIKRTAEKAVWTGSVCTGAFILAAAGELNNCIVTTYWSQLDNLKLLSEKYNFTVVPGYPRFLLDEKNKRFTGGGISSSLDLALKLTEKITSKETAEKAQLFIQYAPGPPTRSGDPCQAPVSISTEVLQMQTGYTADMRQSTLKLLNEHQ